MHRKFRSHLLCGSVLGISLVMVAPMASALEEIIVSARKREENLQAVPVSISVLTAGRD